MTFAIYNDCCGSFKGIHILPALSFYKTSYMAELSFSWLIWTVELRLWDESEREE